MPVDHYENFPVASWLVPGRLRPAIVAIYHYARSADDIADEGTDPPATRLARLDDYARMLDRIEQGETPREAPFAALASAVRRHALPLNLLRDLLSAFRQDVLKTRYANIAELLDYCTRSANPVGRLLLHLYGVDGDARLRQSDAICTGLQLVNFWQDVALDWIKGRVYLPREDMTRFAVTEDDIATSNSDERWVRLLAYQTERARKLLEMGRPLTRVLPFRAAAELKMVVTGGLRVLRSVDAVRGDVFHRRPVLTRRDWSVMLLSAVTRTPR